MELLNQEFSGDSGASILAEDDQKAGDVYTFSYGLPGFESLTKFIVRDVAGFTPFKILHAHHDPTVAFLMIEHKKILPPDIADQLSEALQKSNPTLMSNTSVCVYSVLQYNRGTKGFTANLRAPIVVDESSKSGRQIILDQQALPMNYALNRK
ncbi:MAG: flagellar assembly protein FliW [Fidelibacterota bacterium]